MGWEPRYAEPSEWYSAGQLALIYDLPDFEVRRICDRWPVVARTTLGQVGIKPVPVVLYRDLDFQQALTFDAAERLGAK